MKRIIKKLRTQSRKRLFKHLKTLEKLEKKNIVDNNYVYIRKNAFYNHVKSTKESMVLKRKILPKM